MNKHYEIGLANSARHLEQMINTAHEEVYQLHSFVPIGDEYDFIVIYEKRPTLDDALDGLEDLLGLDPEDLAEDFATATEDLIGGLEK